MVDALVELEELEDGSLVSGRQRRGEIFSRAGEAMGKGVRRQAATAGTDAKMGTCNRLTRHTAQRLGMRGKRIGNFSSGQVTASLLVKVCCSMGRKWTQ